MKTESQQKIRSYHWLHIPSGEGSVKNFDDSHFQEARVPNIDGAMAEADALQLLNDWNGRTNSQYRYWL